MATETTGTPKYKREAKFSSSDGTRVKLYAGKGKNGFNLGASIHVRGQKAKTGMQETVATREEADALMDKRIAEASELGYTPIGTTGSGGTGRRSSFTALPLAPGFVKPVEAPAPAVEQAPAPTKSEPTTVEDVENLVGAGASNKSRRK